MIAINVCDDGTARTIKAQYYKNSAANLSSRGGEPHIEGGDLKHLYSPDKRYNQ